MKNKIEAMGRVIQMLLDEMNNIRTLSIGTLETIKHMPGYDDALGELKEKTKQDKEDGVIKQDSK